jgi:elongation factor Ts
MSAISPQMVKELRDKTGAGMADCKKALTEAEGDMKLAIEVLRKKGAASAAKRADKVANEGIIAARTTADGKKAIIVEINCETDFVARNAEFEAYTNNVADALINNNISSTEELMQINVDGETIEALHNEILAKFSEKIGINRFQYINTDGYVADYIHAGSKLGVLVEIACTSINDEAKVLVRDIAMQVAAMSPSYVNRTEVDNATLEKEKEIYKQQALDQGKKEEIAERIAQGRLDKFYTENCLIEQTFVKDPNKTITDVVNEIAKLTGGDVAVKSFVRVALGESTEG